MKFATIKSIVAFCYNDEHNMCVEGVGEWGSFVSVSVPESYSLFTGLIQLILNIMNGI